MAEGDELFRRWDELQRRAEDRYEELRHWREHDPGGVEHEVTKESQFEAEGELIDFIGKHGRDLIDHYEALRGQLERAGQEVRRVADPFEVEIAIANEQEARAAVLQEEGPEISVELVERLEQAVERREALGISRDEVTQSIKRDGRHR